MPKSDSAGVTLDRASMRAAFERAAASYDAAAVLQREIAERLLERLDLLRVAPTVVLDAGCGTGYCTRALKRRYRRAQVVGLDLSLSRLRVARHATEWFRGTPFAVGDIESLPFAGTAVDMIFSNLSLQWCDPAAAFAEFARMLRPGGVLMFTSFGPDTLKELRAAWQVVDDQPHVHNFTDMHEIGDALIHAGLAEPVMDVDRLTMTYPDVLSVLRDLKALGAHNVAHGRARGLMGKTHFAQFKAAYEAIASGGRIPATYEVVFGHAWAPQGPRAMPEDRVARVPVASLQWRR